MDTPLPGIRRNPMLDDRTFLVVIGAAKCATSWVYHYLSGVPELAVSPLKELHFFNAMFSAHALGDMDLFAIKRLALHLGRDGNTVENLSLSVDFQASVDRVAMIYDPNAYFSHFARLCDPYTRAVCDITPAYSVIGSDGFAYMKRFFATQDVRLKLVFIMRDPVDRFWSQLRHLQEINPDSAIADRWAEAIRAPSILARADYRATVSDLDRVFDSDQILYLFYEDMFTEESLSRFCDFAEIGFQPGDTATRQNETRLSLALPTEAEQAFRELLDPQYRFCRDRFGRAVPKVWKS